MNRKGLVALLDGLQAYAIAFTAIGLAVLLLTNTEQADSKTTYSLNVWAEDIADAIGWSCVDINTGGYWSSNYSTSMIIKLQTSLDNLARENHIIVEVDGAMHHLTAPADSTISIAKEVATATRFLVDSDGNLHEFTVKVGIR